MKNRGLTVMIMTAVILVFGLCASTYAAAPVITINPDSQAIGAPISVTASSSQGVDLYYQTNSIGDVFPNSNFFKFEGSVMVSPGMQIRFVQFDPPGMPEGEPVAQAIAMYPRMQAEKPIITLSPGVPGETTVTISTNTEAADIYYTLMPGEEASVESTKYEGPFVAYGRVEIAAVAIADGYTQSDQATASANLEYTANPVFGMPSHSFSGDALVQIYNTDPDAVIYYTIDGTEPTENSNIYSKSFRVSESTTIKAIAKTPGLLPSFPSTVVYTKIVLLQTPTPEIVISQGPIPGTRLVTMSCGTIPADINYTLDGSQPQAGEGFDYEKPFILQEDADICAVAQADGMLRSEPGNALLRFNRIQAPIIEPNGGSYAAGEIHDVTISAAEGAKIYYTTDGSIPDFFSPIYDKPIKISSYTQIKAFAAMDGFDESVLAAADFVYPIELNITPADGMYEEPVTVTICVNRPDLHIFYRMLPADEQVAYTPYTGPFVVSPGTKLMAVATSSEVFWEDDILASKTAYFKTVQAEQPVISPLSGIYDSPQTVTMTTSTIGARIYYTVGTELFPGIDEYGEMQGSLYESPLQLSPPCQINAVAYLEGLPVSDMTVVKYTIPNRAPVVDLGEDFTIDLLSGTKVNVTMPLKSLYDPDGDEILTRLYLNEVELLPGENWYGSLEEGVLRLPVGRYDLEAEVFDGKLTATDTVNFSVLDKAPPWLKYQVAEPNAAGWYRVPVVVSFQAGDEQGSIAYVSEPVTIAAEGKGQVVTGYAEDAAGNRTTVTLPGISLDMTPPVLDETKIPSEFKQWETLPVKQYASDNLSGMADLCMVFDGVRYNQGEAVPFTKQGEFLLQVVSIDLAGNEQYYEKIVRVVPSSLIYTPVVNVKTEHPFIGKPIVQIDLIFAADSKLQGMDLTGIKLNDEYGPRTSYPGRQPRIKTLNDGRQRVTLWFTLSDVKAALANDNGILTLSGNSAEAVIKGVYTDQNYLMLTRVNALEEKLPYANIRESLKQSIRFKLMLMKRQLENNPGGNEYKGLSYPVKQLEVFIESRLP